MIFGGIKECGSLLILFVWVIITLNTNLSIPCAIPFRSNEVVAAAVPSVLDIIPSFLSCPKITYRLFKICTYMCMFYCSLLMCLGSYEPCLAQTKTQYLLDKEQHVTRQSVIEPWNSSGLD
jgi:hypothetical protein